MTDRVMPHNIEAEKAVIGSMFLNNYAVKKCIESLTFDLFYDEKHQIIYSIIQELVENLKPIDETILIAELRQKNLVEKCGGIEYIGEIITSVPTANHIDAYINIVNDCALRRKLINEATEIISSAHDGESDIRDILDESERKILGVVKARKGGDFKSIQDVMTRTQADIEELFKNPDSVKGLSTGFKQLDQLTNGFHEHELIIIAARPAMGKTAFALNLTINMAKSTPKAVALFNMEMGRSEERRVGKEC